MIPQIISTVAFIPIQLSTGKEIPMKIVIRIPRERDKLAMLIEETYWNRVETYHTSPEFIGELTDAQRHAIQERKED